MLEKLQERLAYMRVNNLELDERLKKKGGVDWGLQVRVEG